MRKNLTRGKAGFIAGFIGTMLAYSSSVVFHWPKNENIFAPLIIGILLSVVVAVWPRSKPETE